MHASMQTIASALGDRSDRWCHALRYDLRN